MPASIYPSENVVSGLSGTIAATGSGIRVRLNGLTLDWVFDLQIMLKSPDGATFVGTPFILWSNIGPNQQVNLNNATITLSDAAASDLPQVANVTSGTYRPRRYSSFATVWPAPAVVTSSGGNSAAPQGTQTFQSRFAGLNPNGTWQLYLIVNNLPTNGSLQSWDLLFETSASTVATTTTLTSAVNPAVIPLTGNSTGTITASVTSNGNPVTTGTVSFSKGAQVLATNVPVNASGQASFVFNTTGATAPVLGEGTHPITANYSGASGLGASSGSLTQVVDRATQVTGNTFCNTGRITLPSTTSTASSVYPSKLFVTGLAGVTQSVIMDINGYTIPQSEDTNLLLVSPTGQKFIPFAYISDTSATTGATIRLSDASANTFANSGAITSGTYRPSYGIFGGSGFLTATFVSPAPAGPYASPAPRDTATFSSAFAGASPNGTWTLYAVNGAGGGPAGTREISNGWCLTFGTSSDPASTTVVSVSPTPSALNQTVTISALVTNASTGAPVNAQGTVTFREGNTVLAGPIALGANGVASFTKPDFTQGAHFIDASYSGAPGFVGLSSGQTLHYVDAPTTNPSAGRFCNTTALTFPNSVGANGSPYPTRINVSGLAGTLSKVTLELNGLTHQFPDDLDLMLTGPNGRSVIAFSDVGGSTAVTGLNLVLDSTSGNALPDSNVLSSGTFRPSDFEVGTDTFGSPAPTSNVFSASTTSLGSAFNNSDPNGIWTLWPRSDNAGVQGGGSLANGWCVNLTMVPPQLTISKTHTANFTQGQVGAQYTVSVGSSGPGRTAGAITVVEAPPAGLSVTAMSGSGWTCSVGTLTCTTSATLNPNSSLPPITVTVNVAANASSPLTNTVSVSGGGGIGASATDTTVINALPSRLLTVSVAGNTWGSVTSLPSGINCPGTCAANFPDGTPVTLTRQVNAATDGEFVGWTDPANCALPANSTSATCAFTMTAAQTAAARFTVSCRLDVDGDNTIRIATDLLAITRRILGITGAPAVAGAFNPSGSRNTQTAINAYITPRIAELRYDVNLDGVIDWRDAMLLSRAASGFVDTAVTDGLITPSSQRQFWAQPTPGGATDGIKQFLNTRCGFALP